jgi:CRISPR/Cas system-associated protein Cas10 (large subunit of type III CRISPR-Cas system)
MDMIVECDVCGTPIDENRAARVWRHPAEGEPAQVRLCQFCQALAQDDADADEE